MRTYSESIGHIKIDWKGVVETMMKNDQDFESFKNFSSGWEDCPCANLSEFIDRVNGGVPRDNVLSNLGTCFHSSFSKKDFEEALNILELINLRGKQLVLQKYKMLIAELSQIEENLKDKKAALRELSPIIN